MKKYLGLRGKELELAIIYGVVMPGFLLFGYNESVAGGLVELESWVETFPIIDNHPSTFRECRHPARSRNLPVHSGIGNQLFDVRLYRPQARKDQDYSLWHQHYYHRRGCPELFIFIWAAHCRSSDFRTDPRHGYLYVYRIPTRMQYRHCAQTRVSGGARRRFQYWRPCTC